MPGSGCLNYTCILWNIICSTHHNPHVNAFVVYILMQELFVDKIHSFKSLSMGDKSRLVQLKVFTVQAYLDLSMRTGNTLFCKQSPTNLSSTIFLGDKLDLLTEETVLMIRIINNYLFYRPNKRWFYCLITLIRALAYIIVIIERMQLLNCLLFELE